MHLLSFAKVMEPRAFFYVPLTLPSPPFWGRGLRRELSRTIKVRGHELSIRRSIIYTNINNYVLLYNVMEYLISEDIL